MLGLVDKYDRKSSRWWPSSETARASMSTTRCSNWERTYVRHERFNDAAAALKRLVNGYPQSPYVVSALSELGLIYQNLGKDDEALRYYKQVVEKYPSSPQVKDAMLGIKNIYVDHNEVDSYLAFARRAGFETDVSAVERDSLSFAAADRVYQNRDYARALNLMDSYLQKYPQGVYRADALFALGDCSLHEGNRQELWPLSRRSVRCRATAISDGLQKAASMRMEDKEYAAAADLYKRLSTTALQKSTVVEALTGYLDAIVATND